MSEECRFSMIGCGRVAQHYDLLLNNLAPVEKVTIAGCCDLEIKRADAMAKAFGCRAYQDAVEMLAVERPDVALILTPSGSHFEVAKSALNTGISVLVEKPVTLIPEQAYELSRIAQSKGLFCASIFQNRYNPAVRKLKDAMDKGRFGKIITASIRLRWCRYQDYYEDGWHGTWAQDGGVINQQAIHHVDALNWICGPVDSVTAAMANRVNDLEAEDTMTATLRLSDGALGTIEVTTAARPEDFEASLSIVGDKGMAQIGGIALNKIENWTFIDSEEGDPSVVVDFSEDVPSGYGLSHSRLLRDFVDKIDADDTPNPIPCEDAVRAVELVHALYASIETGGWVNLGKAPRSSRLGRA